MPRIFLGLLAIGWGLVLIPAGLRRRSERGSFSLLGLGSSIAGLGSALRRSSRRSPAPLWSTNGVSSNPFPGPSYPEAPGAFPGASTFSNSSRRSVQRPQHYVSPAVRRQRQIVLGLFSAAVVTFLLSFVPGLRFLLGLHALVDVALALYFVALLRMKHTRSATRGRPTSRHTPMPRQAQAYEQYYDRAS